jgi:signal transduction histidine kinase
VDQSAAPETRTDPLREAGLSGDAVLELLEALDSATRGIAGVLSFERVLQLIVDRVRELVHARYAALGIADADGVLERFATSGISREERERIGPLPRGRGLLGLLIHDAVAVRIPDIAAHPKSYGFPPDHPPMHSFLGVPIRVRGRVVGDLYLTDKRGAPEFSAADQAIAEMFALHAGIAIENARLHEEVQRLAVVEERERIGQDLHDSIIQSLYALSLSLEDVPELLADDPEEARARIDRSIDGLHLAIRDIRNFIFGLRPERLGQVGLVGGLATVVDEYRLNTMVDIELAAEVDSGEELPPDVVIQLVKIAQEALSNIARHARATRARVSLESGPSAVAPGVELGRELVLEIADNGIGFDPDATRSDDHHGMRNMRARAVSLGGGLEVVSEPGAGTRIIVRIPYPRDA